MDDVPPPEAFEPQPVDARRGGRLRRRIQVVVTVIVIASLIVLAAVGSGGFLVQTPVNVTPAAVPHLAVVDADGRLSTIDGQGGAITPYPATDVRFTFPAWSADGEHIAAIGAGTDGTGVYVFRARGEDAASADPTIIYRSLDRPPFYLYWTPDGEHVTFLTTEPDGLSLRIAPIDGSAQASIVRAGAPMYWDFVDAARLLVHSGTTAPDGFFGEVGLDGAQVDGSARATGVFRAPAVSGDDRFRAYLGAGDGAIGEVVRESRDGSGTTRIRVFGPAAMGFSPTGDELAFVAPDQLTAGNLPLPVGPLRILDVGASEPRTLLEGSCVAFFWSPDGAVIAVLRLDSPGDTVVEAVAREAVARAAVARAELAGLSMRLTFVDAANGSIRSDRLVQVSELFVNQVLPFFDQYALSHRFWSPDATEIVLPLASDDDITRLVAIPADGSDARLLAPAELGFWSP